MSKGNKGWIGLVIFFLVINAGPAYLLWQKKASDDEQATLSQLGECIGHAMAKAETPLTDGSPILKRVCNEELERYRRAFCAKDKLCEEDRYIAATIRSVEASRARSKENEQRKREGEQRERERIARIEQAIKLAETQFSVTRDELKEFFEEEIEENKRWIPIDR
jgi:hypothetical protein